MSAGRGTLAPGSDYSRARRGIDLSRRHHYFLEVPGRKGKGAHPQAPCGGGRTGERVNSGRNFRNPLSTERLFNSVDNLEAAGGEDP